jgi:hypothetical protein
MADVNINIFTNKIYKQGASTVVPGFIQGEEPTPINPSGSGGASEFVPYVGATENFDLGEFGMSAGFFKLDTTPTNTPTDQGTFYWDEDDNTVDIVLNGYIMKIGEDLFYPVKNQTGSSIAKGTNVRFAGTVGASGRLLITPYLADGTFATSRYMGVTAETIDDGEDGKVLWFGRIRGINTNAFNEGDILYASTTVAGGFQTTLPVAPNNVVEVCAVVTKSVNQGVIFVRPQFLGITDSNKVSYNVADNKNATERNQARVNIGSTSATPQVIVSTGAIDDLAITSNNLVFTGASVVLSGIVAGLDGEEITITNINSTALSILNQSALSSANNRIVGSISVPQFSIVRLKYRTTTNRWFYENVIFNDSRYLRKNVADTQTGGISFVNKIATGGATLRANGDTFQHDSSNDSVLGLQIRNSSAAQMNFYGIRVDLLTKDFRVGNPTNVLAATGMSIAGNQSGGQTIFQIENSSANIVFQVTGNGGIVAPFSRSIGSTSLIRRDELYLNYSQTIATAGTINDLAINADCKLLILTGATDLTGVVFVDNTRLLRIEARGGNRIIRDQSASSIAANRFALGADLTINDGEVYQFIYTNTRWRRVL